MLAKICCINSEFCKCQWTTLTNNKNIKLGYVAFMALAFVILLVASDSPSSSTI